MFGPRIGAAYDVTGTQRIVVRGSVGVFYDRLQGDSIFGQIGNPPTGQGSTVVNSTLQQVAQGTAGVQPPPVMLIYDYDAKIGASTSWNGGVQMVLPWSSALDVSYVGTHNYNSVSFGSISVPANNDPMDLNAPDIGTAYLPQYQDPTAPASTIPGARALPTDLLRPYRGLGAIIATRPIFYTQYDSLQTSFNRRFRNGWQGGAELDAEPAAQRQHANRRSTCSTTPTARSVCGPNRRPSTRCSRTSACGGISSRGTSCGIFPNMSARPAGCRSVLAAIANDWQISGVFTGGSGAPYDVTYSYQTAGANVNLTGSPNYRARIRTVGDIGSGCSSDQYAQFNANAFAGPTYNSLGDESGANLLNGCWDNTTDLAIARNIRVGGSRQVQFRLDSVQRRSMRSSSTRATRRFSTTARPTRRRSRTTSSTPTAASTPRD